VWLYTYVLELTTFPRGKFDDYLQVLIGGGKITSAPTLSITITIDPNGMRYILNGNTNVDI
jgi:hypothetical protein